MLATSSFQIDRLKGIS